MLRAIGVVRDDETNAAMARLRERGEQAVRGRGSAVHIWTWDDAT